MRIPDEKQRKRERKGRFISATEAGDPDLSTKGREDAASLSDEDELEE